MSEVRLSARAENVRQTGEWLANETVHYNVLGTRLNRDNARKYISRMRELLDEIERGITEREQAIRHE